MPREKEFDVDAVLDKAMNAFWTRGFIATSLNDLLDCMKIQRASLYNAFDNKHTLYLETLRQYILYRQTQIAKLVKKRSPRQAILGLFREAIAVVGKPGVQSGCFMINTAIELSPHDEKVSEIVCEALTYMEQQFFRKMIEKGRASGEIAESVEPAPTACALLSLFIGLRVLSLSRPEKLLLQSITHQAAALIPPGDKAGPPALAQVHP